MGSVAIFWLQILVSLGVFSLLALWYIWPRLVGLDRNSALAPWLFVHVFRYVGMALLDKGMVVPRLPHGFLYGAAYGDLIAAALSLASIFALRSSWRGATPLVWVANTWGFVDLLNGIRGVIETNVPSYDLASFWYVYTFYAPIVIVSHGLIFAILLKNHFEGAHRIDSFRRLRG
ncbi:hypothetical protein [Streptomyces sp. NPDC010273]|uniref:hypothetical protein n=1 Tax=Streptomyces sp. NPDC010273 TaxID=3364829 RepID=UPI0036E15172